MKKISTIILIACLFVNLLYAQVYTNKVVGKRNQAIADSLKHSEYPYILPIWGDKVTKKGYKLPYSAGLSINYLWQESDLIIDNLYVGFNNGPKYDLKEIIRIKSAVASAGGLTLRPDIWLFPFLNIYGIIGKAKTSTSIDAGLWLPDTTNTWREITSFSSKANFDVTAMGFGLTPTLGVGGGWMALDMNFTWSDVSALDKPVFTYVFGPRFGKTFKLKKEDRNIALWAGGFRLHLSSQTVGSLKLNEVMDIPLDEIQMKVDSGFIKVENAQEAVDNWWNGLTPLEQRNPVNEAKYNASLRTIDAASQILNGVDGALNDGEEASVQYSLNKRPKDMWNFIIGTQFQFNKHFMIRAEYGFLGSRQQFLTSIQYRFGL